MVRKSTHKLGDEGDYMELDNLAAEVAGEVTPGQKVSVNPILIFVIKLAIQAAIKWFMDKNGMTSVEDIVNAIVDYFSNLNFFRKMRWKSKVKALSKGYDVKSDEVANGVSNKLSVIDRELLRKLVIEQMNGAN